MMLHCLLCFGRGPQSSMTSLRPSGFWIQVALPQKGARGQDSPIWKTLHAVEAKHMPGKSLRTSAGSSLGGNLGACWAWTKAATTKQAATAATDFMAVFSLVSFPLMWTV